MANYELIYFPVRGRGEVIRYIFEDNGIAYTDTDVMPFDRWLKEYKPKMPFGQAPCLKDGDFQINQSNAILRHLGRKHDMYGSSVEEATKIDMMIDALEDQRGAYQRMIYQNYEEGRQPFIDALPTQLGFMEKFIVAHGNSASGFVVGNKRSIADYNLADYLDFVVPMSPNCLDDCPNLAAFQKVIMSRPNLVKYRETEAFKTRPRNGNGKL